LYKKTNDHGRTTRCGYEICGAKNFQTEVHLQCIRSHPDADWLQCPGSNLIGHMLRMLAPLKGCLNILLKCVMVKSMKGAYGWYVHVGRHKERKAKTACSWIWFWFASCASHMKLSNKMGLSKIDVNALLSTLFHESFKLEKVSLWSLRDVEKYEAKVYNQEEVCFFLITFFQSFITWM
jgi:hypothetical protein